MHFIDEFETWRDTLDDRRFKTVSEVRAVGLGADRRSDRRSGRLFQRIGSGSAILGGFTKPA